MQSTNAYKQLRVSYITYIVCLLRRSQWPRGLRPLACWDCGFESRRGHGCLSVLSVACCQVERSLWRADHSFREVLQPVMRLCVWSRNLKNEEAMARVGPQRHKKKKVCLLHVSATLVVILREMSTNVIDCTTKTFWTNAHMWETNCKNSFHTKF